MLFDSSFLYIAVSKTAVSTSTGVNSHSVCCGSFHSFSQTPDAVAMHTLSINQKDSLSKHN
jgi:hypothetical protein